MKETTSSVTAAQARASKPRHYLSTTVSTQPDLQYPEPAAESYRWRNHTGVSPSPPLEETLSNAMTNGIRSTRHSAGGTPGSTRSTTSMGRPHRNNPDSRRISPLDDYTSDQPRALHPDHYLRGPSGYLHDPEKASPTRNPVPSGPHTSHTFSTYISEDEEDTKEHTMWILVSQ